MSFAPEVSPGYCPTDGSKARPQSSGRDPEGSPDTHASHPHAATPRGPAL